MVRSLFAIFFVIVPSMTMRSDCRRDPYANTPKRSRSCRAPLAAPNSALQQAVVMLTGHREYMRAQLITFRIGSVSTTLWTMSLSFPTQTLRESARSSIGSSDWADFWADTFRHPVFRLCSYLSASYDYTGRSSKACWTFLMIKALNRLSVKECR